MVIHCSIAFLTGFVLNLEPDTYPTSSNNGTFWVFFNMTPDNRLPVGRNKYPEDYTLLYSPYAHSLVLLITRDESRTEVLLSKSLQSGDTNKSYYIQYDSMDTINPNAIGEWNSFLNYLLGPDNSKDYELEVISLIGKMITASHQRLAIGEVLLTL